MLSIFKNISFDFSVLEILSLVFIVIWGVMYLFPQRQKIQLWAFALSHYLLAFDWVVLQKEFSDVEITLFTILAFSIAILIIKLAKAENKRDFFCLFNKIYLIYTVVVTVLLAFILIYFNYFFDISFLALQH